MILSVMSYERKNIIFYEKYLKLPYVDLFTSENIKNSSVVHIKCV